MRNKKGFTLGELLIVVAIIAILVAIAIPIFKAQDEKARRAVDIDNARQIQTAISTAISCGDLELGGADILAVYLCNKKSMSTNGVDAALNKLDTDKLICNDLCQEVNQVTTNFY